MSRVRVYSRLPAVLALLAIVLRTLLPALHSHVACAHADAIQQTAANAETTVVVCSCGLHHCQTSDDCEEGGSELSDASVELRHCLACQLESGTPFGLVQSSVVLVGEAAWPECAQRHAGITPARLDGLPESRAPPGDEA